MRGNKGDRFAAVFATANTIRSKNSSPKIGWLLMAATRTAITINDEQGVAKSAVTQRRRCYRSASWRERSQW